MTNHNQDVTIALMDSATQLLVADRHRHPKGQAREPLNEDEAEAYVRDAARLWMAANWLVKDSVNSIAGNVAP